MDNRIFNVNGSGLEMLTQALELAFLQEDIEARGYTIDPAKGLILVQYLSNGEKTEHSFMTPLDAKAVTPLVFAWLESDDAKKIK